MNYALIKMDEYGVCRQSGKVNKLARLKTRLSKFKHAKGWIQEVSENGDPVSVVAARGFSKACMERIPVFGVEALA